MEPFINAYQKPYIIAKFYRVMDFDVEYLTKLIDTFGTAFISFIIACSMALMRTRQRHGKADWLEGGMCGLFAVSAWSLLDWLNIPQIVAVGLSSAIGYMGTSFISRLIERKVNLQNDDDSTSSEA